MAEAYGRLTRKPGVALVTAGPGFTNSLTAVASAHFANTPLVLIAGCVGLDSREKLDLQDMRQAPVIEPMVKKALVCQQTERIPEFIDVAFRTAAGGRPGPGVPGTARGRSQRLGGRRDRGRPEHRVDPTRSTWTRPPRSSG